MSVLAVDASTTGVTALVVEPDGSVAATGHQALAQHVPQPGWVEHAAEEIWQATLGATRAALAGYDGGRLEAVGITNQPGTTLLWDRDTLGSPRRAIGRQDRRTAELCARLRDQGHGARVAELTGLRLDPGLPGTTLRWLAEHEPHTWALVESGRYAIGTVDSYLVARMTRGTYHVTDVSNAGRTLLLDLETGDWSDELCSLLGVPRDALPELVPSWGRLATTDPVTFLGLSLPVSGMAGHQQAALFGQTCFDEGDSACTYDTESFVLTTTGATIRRSDVLLASAAWRSPDGEITYCSEASVVAPGGAVPWLRDEPAVTGSAPEISGEVVRAALEAVAHETRDVFELMPPRPDGAALRVGGRGSVDDLLCQLQADQLGVPVERPTVVETAGLGAAFLAGLGVGVWSSTDELRETWTLDRRFEPSPDRSTPDADHARWSRAVELARGWAD